LTIDNRSEAELGEANRVLTKKAASSGFLCCGPTRTPPKL